MTWGISFDEISVSLVCCITGLWHPINRNYVFKSTQLLRAAFATPYWLLPNHLIFSKQTTSLMGPNKSCVNNGTSLKYVEQVVILLYKRIGYNINVMQQSACLVINPITVDNFASLCNCTPVGCASDSMMGPT